MADTLKLRGGNTADNAGFTGADREVTVDTEKKTLVVHDGTNAGGTPLMKESGGNAATTVGIGTGGTNAISIDSSQRVGINRGTPQANLDVDGSVIFRSTLVFSDDTLAADSSSGTEKRIKMGNNSDLQLFHDGRSGKDNSVIRSRKGDLQINSGNSAGNVEINLNENVNNETKELSAKFIKNGGVELYHNGLGPKLETTSLGVDISGSSPALRVVGTSSTPSKLTLSSAGITAWDFICNESANSALTFNKDGSTKFTIDTSGNCGIGTTNPQANLSVASNTAFIDIGPAGGNRGKIGYTSDDLYIGTTAGAGKLIFKNNIGSTDNPASSGSTLMTIDASGNAVVGSTTANDANACTLNSDGEVRAAGFYFSNNIGTAMSSEGIRRLTTGTMVFDTASTPRMTINGTGDVGINGGVLELGTADSASGHINAFEELTFNIDSDDDDNDTRAFRFLKNGKNANGDELFRIQENGNVGINETSPETLLHISDGRVNNGPIILIEGSGQNAKNNLLGGINFKNLDTSGDGPTITGAIRHFTANDSGNGGYLTFHTHDGSEGGEESDAVERLRVDQSGRVLIGTQTEGNANADDLTIASSGATGMTIRSGSSDFGRIFFSDATSGNAEFAGFVSYDHANNKLLLGANESTRLTIDSSGNIGAPSGTNIHNASDSRLKKNVVDIDKGLSSIKSLRPVSFNWIDGFCDEEKDTLYGFIAQEVQSVDSNLIQNFSEEIIVDGNKIENVLRVNEKFIIPMLVKAVKELSAKVEALEAA